MNVIAQAAKGGGIVFLDTQQGYAEVASIEPWFSGWVVTVGADDPETALDIVFKVDEMAAARQAVYAELIRRNKSKCSTDV